MKATLLVAMIVGAPSTALAYSDGTVFSKDPSAETSGGGGGLYFTGSPRQHGLDCAVCHVGGPTDITLELSALLDGTPARLFEDGYTPGALYEIQVAFTEDRLAPAGGCEGHDDEPCDVNAFAFELLDAAAHPVGTLCATAPVSTGCDGCVSPRAHGTLTADECSVILTDSFDGVSFSWRNGVTAYSFFWRAPDEDAGPVTAYVSGVDGRGQESEDGEVTSYANDGVVRASVVLGAPDASPSSCRATGGPMQIGLLLLLGMLSWTRWVHRPRRDARRDVDPEV